MLKRRLSLAARAALIFVSIYVAIFFAALAVVAATNSAEDERGRHAGPAMALAFAAGELEETGGSFHLPRNGTFARFAARNPSLWLLSDRGGRRFSLGPVPRGAHPLIGRFLGGLEAGEFHVPGVRRPLAYAAVQRRQLGSGPILLAAGGIDPATISALDSFRFFLTEGIFVILLWIGLLGLVAMLVALPLLTLALKPIAAEAMSIRPESPERRLREETAPRELLPVLRSFNAALDRLSAELERRKRFIADVAHELRTPLAIASLRIDSLTDEEAKRDLHRGIGRLSHLVAQMLDVERLSLGGRQGFEIDLAALARDVTADMAPMALAAGYELSLEAPSASVPVSGDPHALERAVGSLIGNAIAHAGGRGRIQVVVSRNRTLDVVDEGPGISPAMRSRLFEPFARERWDADGCGLGLHLTREIMRAHGGDAHLLPADRGATFRLEFPEASCSRHGTAES